MGIQLYTGDIAIGTEVETWCGWGTIEYCCARGDRWAITVALGGGRTTTIYAERTEA